MRWILLFGFFLGLRLFYGQQMGIISMDDKKYSKQFVPLSLPIDSISLNKLDILLMVSSSKNGLQDQDVKLLEDFVKSGGLLYLGNDNWPFIEESNFLLTKWFGIALYELETNRESKVLRTEQYDAYLQSNSYIPVHHQLEVLTWFADQPLVVKGKIGLGSVIIDGGFSRYNHLPAEQLQKDLLNFPH